ncbi:asparagine synthase (glutamine-hydrolyzing) [Butyrivibrio sp. AE2032]|uniref:asparagine synthase (glutamine-hydrolyzing) n=1 Tax=Butyrivibrio sp. AE2032 TaxID=1458463 RepID=UPI0006906B82|nr:asparagine synthase (glutamine-hydrolyzing) [Butyrivibrio sp. AE2032]
MCGIAACIQQKGKIDKDKFDRMTDIISYRGPDDRGVYYDGNLALGHRRLSIIDLSSDGHQPFEKIEGYVLVYNGEIYNYIELRDELEAKGYVFKTKTDTEVIIHAYREWGGKCVCHFNGMWAFVLYDKKKQQLFCSRDRFGVKPFYYTEQEGMFLVASEIKQFFQILKERPKANRDMLLQYIIRGTNDVAPYTMFKDIYQLNPGHNMVYDLATNRIAKERYYSIANSKEIKIRYEDACSIFTEAFSNAVMLRLRSDVPVGYFLSGGLDSSAIVCTADKNIRESGNCLAYQEQHTISACFKEKNYDEQEYIDEVIKVTNIIPHKIFPSTETLWDDLDNVIWHMDEPLGSTSTFAQWSVCKAAKEHGLTVMLDGQGADEQLAGYTAFYTVLFVDALKKFKFRYLKKEVDAYLRLRAQSEKHISSTDIILSAIRECLMPKVLHKFIKRVYLERVQKIPFDKKIIRKTLENEYIYPQGKPREFIKAYVENELLQLLHRGDRNSMAFSIETREPFLDYQLADALFEMPYEYKIREGYSKAVLRDGLKGTLPEKVRMRVSKFGFVTPEEKWIKDNSEIFRNELVQALAVFEELFDTDRVLEWYDQNNSNIQRGNSMIWRIIDSARWARIFNVSI